MDRAGDADATEIFKSNRALMQQADIGLFNLTPFRGPSADAGTVFELGLMFGMGKPVYGYSSAVGEYRDRVTADGYEIEDFGAADNLMITEGITCHGEKLVCLPEESGDPLPAFSAFEHVLAEMMQDLLQLPS